MLTCSLMEEVQLSDTNNNQPILHIPMAPRTVDHWSEGVGRNGNVGEGKGNVKKVSSSRFVDDMHDTSARSSGPSSQLRDEGMTVRSLPISDVYSAGNSFLDGGKARFLYFCSIISLGCVSG